MPGPQSPSDDPRGAANGKSGVSIPQLALPKGGGAIRGVGEKFAANPVTGTGSMTVPIAASPGRSGFGPQLSLSYDSGAGNGPFGFGWSLSLPAITRKTEKGLPQYRDAEESDVFILSGAEDLVPVLVEVGGQWQRETLPSRDGIQYRIQRYRPRIEGLFARIERWIDLQSGEIHWRSISRDNVTTLYGKTAASRIADPADPTRVFSWLICESYDDKGNAIVYGYKEENSHGVEISQVHEKNRISSSRSANRYLKRIRYANRVSRLLQPDLSQADWMFEVVFDYGEHDPDDPRPNDASEWLCRHDPFSSYRAGFEVRTYRLCQRVLMFHHFPGEEGIRQDCLVRSTDFVYRNIRNNPDDLKRGHPVTSFIASVTQSGYKRQVEGGYLKKSLPPLECEYSQAEIQDAVQEVDAESLENLPYGLDGSSYHWVDLDGEGLSGVLTEQAEALFYKPNLGGGRFGPVEKVAVEPSLTALGQGQQHLLDLAGDGQLDLVTLTDATPGFFERTHDQRWKRFKAFLSLPNIPWGDPNLRFIDLSGDGHPDVLVTENDVLTWYPSLAEGGFGPATTVRKPDHEEKGPRLVFADGTLSIHLADISGDGLTDLVRIRNGEVCYWPNLGYGRFGAKITMDNAPWFDSPDLFDQGRIRLADIDGSGVTDLLYLGGDGVRLYFNQSGNSWANSQPLPRFPRIDNLSAVTALDLLGNGTACLVWSSPLPGDSRQAMRYVDLMGGQKPHLLVRVVNNLGAETHVQYVASTECYLADKLAGRPWITRLPFPVHVVERVDTYDWISRTRFVTRYVYHHGYFDGIEREFRGFGMVEQWDTEEFAALNASDDFPDAENIDQAAHVAPVLTRTWFHTGAYLDGSRITRQFQDDYYRESDLSQGMLGLTREQWRALLLDDTVLPGDFSAEEAREVCRSLKGAILRQEIYARDGTDEEERPYSVSERNYTIKRLQPHAANKHAVFFAHPRETIGFHYERKLYEVGGRSLADPRVSHAMTLAVDDFGNVLQSVAIGYGRRHDGPDRLLTDDDRNKQKRPLVTCTENGYTNAVREPDDYRVPLLCETHTYELLNVRPEANEPDVTNLCGFEEMSRKVQAAADGQHDLPYEDITGVGVQGNAPFRRLIERARNLYLRNDLTGYLPRGQLESLALPCESYQLAFTPGLLSSLYQRTRNNAPPENLLPDPANVLGGTNGARDRGGYVDLDGNGHWWIPSGHVFYHPDPDATAEQELEEARRHFFLPRRFTDPFGHSTFLDYDGYDLLPIRTTDAVQNTITAVNDYRVLQPGQITDPNGNHSEAEFDTLGMVVGTAVMGKAGEDLGDSWEEFATDLTQQQIDAFFDADDPHLPAEAYLASAGTRIIYDLDRFRRTRDANHDDPTTWAPVFAATLARETHVSDPLSPGGRKIQISISYSDGFGREIQKKVQAERQRLPDGTRSAIPQWAGSGWTIFNNKGKPVRQYEPFFSTLPDRRHQFEFARKEGVSPVLFYDPLGRVVATLYPNHTYEKVVFDPWRQATWDVNDTVQIQPQDDPDVGAYFRRLPDAGEYLPTWHARRVGGELGSQEQAAASEAAMHADTPAVAHFDALGRAFLSIAHNKFQRDDAPVEEQYLTRYELDIEGNQRAVIDARNRIVMRYDYDMLGNRIHQASMDAGERWMLHDVTGKPIRVWESRGHTFRTEYDSLRRPVRSFVTGADANDASREILFEQTVYGEDQPNDTQLNLRTRVFQQYDEAGVVTHMGRNPRTDRGEAYDFKGNLLHSTSQLLQQYREPADWLQTPALADEIFVSSTHYDALNRPIQIIAPHTGTTVNVIQPGYNEASLLERVDVWLAQATEPAMLLDRELVIPALVGVENIDYNAKGQRTRIEYKNGVTTAYTYDPDTFRLTHLLTRRQTAEFPEDCPGDPNPPCGVQNLHYTHDPAGNITHIRDDAQQTIYFRNHRVEPSAEYTYDAIYRLIEATGREHLGQVGGVPTLTSHTDVPRTGLEHPNDRNAMGWYEEEYRYDEVGNILSVRHHGSDPQHSGWKRCYQYANDSNRLLSTGSPGDPDSSCPVYYAAAPFYAEPYEYDAHGNMISMPHLSVMEWDFKDQLHMTRRQAVNADDADGIERQGERTYYVYDAAGQRARKVTERQNGTPKKERIYLGGFEIYREYNGDGETVTLERETLHIMDDKQRIALVETRTQGSDVSAAQLIRYQFGNHLGSASLELDEQAQIISYEEYYPYGSTSYQAVRTGVEVSQKRYRYTGKERDEESGLYYHGARYYAAWLGRWTSGDPAGLLDGVNVYSFVHNSPLRFNDPAGLQQSDPTVAEALRLSRSDPIAFSGGISMYDGRVIPEPRTLAEHPLLGRIAREEWQVVIRESGNVTDSRKLFRKLSGRITTRVKNLLENDPSHELGNLFEVAYREGRGYQLRFKSGAFHGQWLELAHNVSVREIQRFGANRRLAAELNNLYSVGEQFHRRFLHVEQIATGFGRRASEEAAAGIRQYADEAARAGSETTEVGSERVARRIQRGRLHSVPIIGIPLAVPDILEAGERGEIWRGLGMIIGTAVDPLDWLVLAHDQWSYWEEESAEHSLRNAVHELNMRRSPEYRHEYARELEERRRREVRERAMRFR